MQLNLDPKVTDLGVVIDGVEISGVDNSHYPTELSDYINEEVTKVLADLDADKIKSSPIIQGFFDLHKRIHLPKRNNRPSPETLLKLILKRGELFPINPVVDLYNVISIKSQLALGAHDIEHIVGDVNLRITTGDEKFVPIGANNEPQAIKAGEYGYIDDDNEVICHLETRQVEKTKITPATNHIFYIVQGNTATSQEYVDQVANELLAATTKYLGGQGKLLTIQPLQ